MRTRYPLDDKPGYSILADNSIRPNRGILVPDALAREIEAEDRAAHERKLKRERERYCEDESKPVASSGPDDSAQEAGEEEPEVSGHGWIVVFDPDATYAALNETEAKDRDFKRRAQLWHKAALQWEGKRRLPEKTPRELKPILDDLAARFPNFREALTTLQTEMALALALPKTEFRVSPILLYGAPGIGKTLFAATLAEELGLGFEKFSAGGMQGAFDLVGTSTHWNNSHPGRIFRVLSENISAAPVLLIDEIDKFPKDDRYPVLPAFLDLLEGHSARKFRDEAAGLVFDASHILVVATANDLSRIAEPLLSRLLTVEVAAPTPAQRRQIAQAVFEGMRATLTGDLSLEFESQAFDRLAEAPSDLRAVIRSIRQAVGSVLVQGRRRIVADDLVLPDGKEKGGRRIGFI